MSCQFFVHCVQSLDLSGLQRQSDKLSTKLSTEFWDDCQSPLSINDLAQLVKICLSFASQMRA
ncbi:MAG: hypothetical protein EB066_02435 [Betaproteobacteria bacterium]|nr:hypothetical protein [Betaproteobacteria bacterium]NDF05283.1 hypothetical protein [Betaproteobacteria bacterium]